MITVMSDYEKMRWKTNGMYESMKGLCLMFTALAILFSFRGCSYTHEKIVESETGGFSKSIEVISDEGWMIVMASLLVASAFFLIANYIGSIRMDPSKKIAENVIVLMREEMVDGSKKFFGWSRLKTAIDECESAIAWLVRNNEQLSLEIKNEIMSEIGKKMMIKRLDGYERELSERRDIFRLLSEIHNQITEWYREFDVRLNSVTHNIFDYEQMLEKTLDVAMCDEVVRPVVVLYDLFIERQRQLIGIVNRFEDDLTGFLSSLQAFLTEKNEEVKTM